MQVKDSSYRPKAGYRERKIRTLKALRDWRQKTANPLPHRAKAGVGRKPLQRLDILHSMRNITWADNFLTKWVLGFRVARFQQSHSIRELTKVCLSQSESFPSSPPLTGLCDQQEFSPLLTLSFRFDKAGHYLSTFKQFEHKPPELIKERVDKDYQSTTLTSIGKVNKTDVETLRTSFGEC